MSAQESLCLLDRFEFPHPSLPHPSRAIQIDFEGESKEGDVPVGKKIFFPDVKQLTLVIPLSGLHCDQSTS